jgi:hypothetical protein
MTKTTATFNDNETITYGGHRDVTFCWRIVRKFDGKTITGFSMTRELAAKRAEQVVVECVGPELPKRGAVPMSYRIHKDRENMRRWGTINRKELMDIRTKMRAEAMAHANIELAPAN